MKLIVERNVLLNAVQNVIGAVARKSTLPILSFLHFKGDGSTITLTATDLETTLLTRFRVEHEPFEALLPAKRLYDLLRAFPDGSMIGFQRTEQKITIKCGKSRFVLATLDPQDYPITPDLPLTHHLTLPVNQFHALLDTADYAVAHKDVRHYLNGLMIEMGEQLTVTSTDGHRCATISMPLDTPYETPEQRIIPSEALDDLKKLLKNDCAIDIGFAKNRFIATLDHSIFITQVIDGEFPDIQRVIPKNNPLIVEIPREALLSAINRISLINDDKSKGIGIEIRDNKLLLKSRNNDDEGEEVLDIEFDGSVVFGMNASYLQDTLRAIQSNTVRLSMSDSVSSLRIDGVESDEGIHVVMPMRL